MNIKKQLDICNSENINLNKLNICLALHEYQEQPDDNTLKELLQKYLNGNSRGELFELEIMGYVEIFPKAIDGEQVNFTKIRLTEKFTKLLFAQDKEKCFADFIEIFGRSYYINDKLVSTLNPEKGCTFQDLEDKFWKISHNGNLSRIESVFKNTELYKKYVSESETIQMNISTFLNGYQGFLMTLEDRLNEINKYR